MELATRIASSEHPRPDEQDDQTQHVAGDQGLAVVRESGDDGLHGTVTLLADGGGADEREEREHPDHQQRREHSDGEEVVGSDDQDADPTVAM